MPAASVAKVLREEKNQFGGDFSAFSNISIFSLKITVIREFKLLSTDFQRHLTDFKSNKF
jgi:hypothetical protein